MITIRECRISDAGRICELNKVLGYDYPPEKTKQNLLAILKRPSDRIFVACVGETVAGYIQVCDYECCYMDSMKNIVGLVVDHSFQKSGVGKALLTATEDWAREQGCAGVRLHSGAERTEAHKFYEHCGYFHKKSHKNYIKLFEAVD